MPPNDPEISRIITEAQRLRAKEAKAAEKDERKDKPKTFASLSIESLRAYREMYPHPPTMSWFLLFLFFLVFFVSSLFEKPLFPHDALVFGVITGLLALYGIFKGQLMPILWYARFHTWRQHLPYALNGWDEFGSSTHILDSLEWRNLSITINTPNATTAFDAALDAIITILIRDIGDVTYKEDVGEPSRRDWTWNAKNRTITGSANSQVLGLLIDFFRAPMGFVVKRFGSNVTIAIVPDGDWYHVKERPMRQTVG